MLKTTTKMLMAMMFVGVSAAQIAAASTQVQFEAADKYTDTQGTWTLAHVSQWSHYHVCNPSPCKKLKNRHKKGTGSVTESAPGNGSGVNSLQGAGRR